MENISTAPETPKAEALFEVSWEVCNKVGGINTVIRNKSPLIQKRYANYVLIGPYFGRSNAEFERRPLPLEWQDIFKALSHKGIACHYGVWLIPGEPTTILLDSSGLRQKKNEIKYDLWSKYKIDSLNASPEFDDPLCFATAAGMLVEEYAKRNPSRIVAQFHEWLAGFGILYLKSANAKVGTVFTTHATILGRSIASSNYDLYTNLEKLNPTEWAYKLNVQEKHLAEVACAQHADVFTTVSEITAIESEKLLGRKPDILVLNGLSLARFLTLEETTVKHVHSRERLRELISYVFFPYYLFDLNKTLIFYVSGRYEFHNKGLDVFIAALDALNQRLKEENIDVTIVVFFWIINAPKNVKHEIIENKSFYYHIKSSIEWQSRELLQKVVFDFISGQQTGQQDLFTSDFLKELRADTRHFRRNGVPPIIVHDIENEQWDPIVNSCRTHKLNNLREDKVKVVIYPTYLDGTDNLLDMEYYDAVVGAHLGVFPSFYEPWGYTPLESAALSVPTVTTDLTGFGRYIRNYVISKSQGVYVLQRFGKNDAETTQQLSSFLYHFSTLDRFERIQAGTSAKSLASLCDWKHFIKYYVRAHNLALERKGLTDTAQK